MERFKAIVSRFWLSLTVIICLGFLFGSLFLIEGFLKAQFPGNSALAGLIVGAFMASLVVTFMMSVISSGRITDLSNRNYHLKQMCQTAELTSKDFEKQAEGLEAELKSTTKELNKMYQENDIQAAVIQKLLAEMDEMKERIKDPAETLTESKSFIETVRDMGLNNLKICGEIPGEEPVLTNVNDLKRIM